MPSAKLRTQPAAKLRRARRRDIDDRLRRRESARWMKKTAEDDGRAEKTEHPARGPAVIGRLLEGDLECRKGARPGR